MCTIDEGTVSKKDRTSTHEYNDGVERSEGDEQLRRRNRQSAKRESGSLMAGAGMLVEQSVR